MRRHQKQQVEDFIHLLEEVHGDIKKALRSGETDAAQALLAQCQEGAVSAGTLIESIEGEGTPTVARLEDYCEQVYQCCEALQRKDPAMSGSRVYKALSKSLFEVKKSVKQDLKVRTEIVFFPYKASMWDSLESVWLAADADPDCDAYVVPIPYYEKNPDGSLGRMRYEGDNYPFNVPVVDWRTYDLEKRRPDAAFIHNPYDDENFVTQVHELYFSRNLKKYVGLLCYIPYFVAARGANPHFAQTPAVINSDVIIVESEKVRQGYLSVWKQAINRSRAVPDRLKNIETRILALGSPKYDAVFSAGKGAFPVPDEWKRLLDLDGSRKKVVFYNTSIDTMLENTINERGEIHNQYLQKIESVLLYFKQHKEAVLLWRPHPLMGQTLASMRPGIYEEYRRIVHEYRESGYGIYDDSADLYRAIAFSDAYYGDSSSVMYLWEKTGRPLLLNNTGVTSYQHRLVVRNLYFDGSRFWCTADDFNGLFQIDRDTMNVHYAGQFPGEKKERCNLFGRIAECGGKLYFAPWSAESIGVYDKQTGEFSSIPIPLDKKSQKLPFKYYAILVYQECVYVIGNQIDAVLRIDSRTNKITVLDGWKRQLEARKADERETFFSDACQSGSKAYLFSKYANIILCLDLADGQWEMIHFPKENRKYAKGISVKNRIWFLASNKASVGFYDITAKRLVELDAPDLFARGFSSMQAYQDDIYCFSPFHTSVLKIDGNTCQMRVYQCAETCDTSVVDGKYAYIVSKFTGRLQRLDLETMESHVEDMLCPEIPEMPGSSILEASQSCTGFARENAFLNLDTLVDATRDFLPDDRREQAGSGEAIYRYIKKVIS